MMDLDCDAPQPKVSLPDYLEQRGWKVLRRYSDGDEVAGLCPLHCEQHPSFYVNLRKQVFYCHGCGCGGGLAQLIYLLDDYPDPANDYSTAQSSLEHTYAFYQHQLGRYPAARDYLKVRVIHDPSVIERMRIGYAPGAFCAVT